MVSLVSESGMAAPTPCVKTERFCFIETQSEALALRDARTRTEMSLPAFRPPSCLSLTLVRLPSFAHPHLAGKTPWRAPSSTRSMQAGLRVRWPQGRSMADWARCACLAVSLPVRTPYPNAIACATSLLNWHSIVVRQCESQQTIASSPTPPSAPTSSQDAVAGSSNAATLSAESGESAAWTAESSSAHACSRMASSDAESTGTFD